MKKKELIEKKAIELFGDQSKLANNLISPAIGIKLLDKANGSNQIPSKIGGWPDVGEYFIWPEEAGYPLTFLCQINLDNISKFNSSLPSHGILYFFVASPECEDAAAFENAVKVVYADNLINGKSFKAKTPPLDEYGIQFYQHYTLPSYQENIRWDSDLLAEMSDGLDELEQFISELTYNNEDFTKHHMLGDPNAVQGSVRPFWGAKWLYPQDVHYSKLPDCLDQASAIGDDFVLLLQIDLLDERISLPNCDCCLYFGILKDDLITKNFDRVKLVIQNT